MTQYHNFKEAIPSIALWISLFVPNVWRCLQAVPHDRFLFPDSEAKKLPHLMLVILNWSPFSVHLIAEMTLNMVAAWSQGVVVVAVKGLGVSFYVWLLRPCRISGHVKIIGLIYFSVNTSLCNMSSAICDTCMYIWMCQGKRYYCCAHDDGAGHLAENNGHFTVKHIALIRSSHAGRAELEMHLSAQTLVHTFTCVHSHTSTHAHSHFHL